MFWGGIMLGAKTPLLPLQHNTLMGRRYVDLVLEPIVSLWRAAIEDNFNFMHDSAPSHTSTVTRECLETEGVILLDWPACSPDLNPIEHLWEQLKRRVRARQNNPVNLARLIDAALAEWKNIPQDNVDNLIRSTSSALIVVMIYG